MGFNGFMSLLYYKMKPLTIALIFLTVCAIIAYAMKDSPMVVNGSYLPRDILWRLNDE